MVTLGCLCSGGVVVTALEEGSVKAGLWDRPLPHSAVSPPWHWTLLMWGSDTPSPAPPTLSMSLATCGHITQYHFNPIYLPIKSSKRNTIYVIILFMKLFLVNVDFCLRMDTLDQNHWLQTVKVINGLFVTFLFPQSDSATKAVWFLRRYKRRILFQRLSKIFYF